MLRALGLTVAAAAATAVGATTTAAVASVQVAVMCRDASLSEMRLAAELRVDVFCGRALRAVRSAARAQRLVFEEDMSHKSAVIVAVASDSDRGRRLGSIAGQVVGCADVLLEHRGDGIAWSYITDVCVHPRARRRGVASCIMQEVERRATDLGSTELVLHVEEANVHARALYASLAFDEVPAGHSLAGHFSAVPFIKASSPPQRLLHKSLASTPRTEGGEIEHVPSVSSWTAHSPKSHSVSISHVSHSRTYHMERDHLPDSI